MADVHIRPEPKTNATASNYSGTHCPQLDRVTGYRPVTGGQDDGTVASSTD